MSILVVLVFAVLAVIGWSIARQEPEVREVAESASRILGVRWLRIQALMDRAKLGPLVSAFRGLSWAVVLLLAAVVVRAGTLFGAPENMSDGLEGAAIVTAIAIALLAWNNFRTSENFSIPLMLAVSTAACMVVGGALMFLGRPHPTFEIALLGGTLFCGAGLFLQATGVLAIRILGGAWDWTKSALDIVANLIQDSIRGLPEALDALRMKQSGTSAVPMDATARWHRGFGYFWFTTLPFVFGAVGTHYNAFLTAVLFASFAISLKYGFLEVAGVDTKAQRQRDAIMFASLMAGVIIIAVVRILWPSTEAQQYDIFNSSGKALGTGLDDTNEFINTYDSWVGAAVILWPLAVLGFINKTYGFTKDHEWTKQGPLCKIGLVLFVIPIIGFTNAYWQNHKVPVVISGYDVAHHQTYVEVQWPRRGEGVWIRRREGTDSTYTSQIWLPASMVSWRDVNVRVGEEHHYLISFTKEAPPAGDAQAIPPSDIVFLTLPEAFGLARPAPPFDSLARK